MRGKRNKQTRTTPHAEKAQKRGRKTKQGATNRKGNMMVSNVEAIATRTTDATTNTTSRTNTQRYKPSPRQERQC